MNLYKQFRKLIPDPPRQVGDVVAYADGVATLELPGGAQVQAHGEATVGDRVFFRAGAIEGPAPDLDFVEIDL